MGNEIINAITKNRPSEEVLRKMTEVALGHDVEIFSFKELAGGLCNAVYALETEYGRMVLKIAPPKDVVVMSHEKNYVPTEAIMLKTFEEKINIPAPKLINFDDSLSVYPVPYFFMSFVEGTPLTNVEPKPDREEMAKIKYQVGKICSQISSIPAELFGIPNMPETYTKSNFEFVKKLFHLLFLDAEYKNIVIPETSEDEFMKLLYQCQSALDEVKNPVYIHTDTWDGNLMIKDGKLKGLVDYAAILYGDQLMNHDFHDFGDSQGRDFLNGFGKKSFSKSEWIRILVYRIWQRLGMIVERGFRGYDESGIYEWVLGEYVKEIKNLKYEL